MNRVQIKIQQHLRQPVRVSLNGRQRRVRHKLQLNRPTLRVLADQLQRVVNYRIEIHRLQRQVRGLHQFQQFTDHPV